MNIFEINKLHASLDEINLALTNSNNLKVIEIKAILSSSSGIGKEEIMNEVNSYLADEEERINKKFRNTKR